jgi:Holliday junction resolvasome RuvABC endonuclease subunit
MNILAIDPGTYCGWAVLHYGALSSGVQVFVTSRGSSPGLRFLKFNTWFREMLQTFSPKLVVYEQAHFRGGYATELLVGFTTRIMENCAAGGIEYAAVHTGKLKKWAVGSGRAEKQVLIDRISARIGTRITDEHEADALWLLLYGQEFYSRARARPKEVK